MNRLVEKYQKTVIESLMKQFNYSSVMQCPKVEKVVINMGAVSYTHLDVYKRQAQTI